jgi:hypothetical protein
LKVHFRVLERKEEIYLGALWENGEKKQKTRKKKEKSYPAEARVGTSGALVPNMNTHFVMPRRTGEGREPNNTEEGGMFLSYLNVACFEY